MNWLITLWWNFTRGCAYLFKGCTIYWAYPLASDSMPGEIYDHAYYDDDRLVLIPVSELYLYDWIDTLKDAQGTFLKLYSPKPVVLGLSYDLQLVSYAELEGA